MNISIRKGLLLFFYISIIACGKKDDKNPKQGGMPDLPISADGYVVVSGSLEEDIKVPGTVIPAEQVELRSEIQGKVISILFNEGQRVRKGELLVKLFDADLQAQLRKTEAQIKLAEQTLKRLSELLKINGSSRQEFDEAEAMLEQLKADADLIKARISQTEVRAPFSGLTGIRYVSEGAVINNNQIIARLIEDTGMKAEFSVPERYADNIKAGEKVTLRNPATKKNFSAVIYAMDALISESNRALRIRARISEKGLIPGEFVEVSARIRNNPHALLVPAQAIVPEAKGKKVFVSVAGKATPQLVETGLRSENRIEILSGLKVGDTIAINGLMKIKPGAALKFKNFKKP
jgi:membrane fusion protein (multidrug efflux system)